MPRRKPDAADLFTSAPLPVAELGAAERLACLRLIRSENVGPVTFRALINHFGGAQQALEMLPELAKRGGRGRPVRICPRDRAEAELEAAAACDTRPVFTIEPGYPAALAATTVPPPMLYVRGRTELLNQHSVGIVGSRQSSAAGQKLARQFARDLGLSGFVVVSGLARGIDKAAHEASLETGTIAVLAGGPDNVYPPEHAELQDAIARQGCLISEMPPGFSPRGQDFPRRNRIIAGISLGVLVVEAARRSGSLITAQMATEMGRDVFAVPGNPLDPRAEGANKLLKEGATLVTEAADIVGHLRPLTGAMRSASMAEMSSVPDARLEPPPLIGSDHRAAVMTALGAAPIDLDEIARAAGLTARAARLVLIELDLAGRIEHHGQQMVSLRPLPTE